MPWVERHRRRLPYSWFRSTTVRSHYRRPTGLPIIWIVIGVAVVLFLLILAFS